MVVRPRAATAGRLALAAGRIGRQDAIRSGPAHPQEPVGPHDKPRPWPCQWVTLPGGYTAVLTGSRGVHHAGAAAEPTRQGACMPGFTYLRAETLEQVLALLRTEGDGTKLLAGGQSLVPMITLGLVEPRLLVDLNRLPGLDYARVDDGVVAVGPLARHRALERTDPALAAAAPLLPLAARLIGHAAIRTRGTLLGSLAHADPAAEWPAVALALGAELRLASARGERRLPADAFFLGPLTTALEPDELLLEARWPAAPPRTGAAVQELVYRYGDFAIVGVAAQLSLGTDGAIAAAHLGLFGVAGTPVRARTAEQALLGAGPEAFAAAAREAQAAAEPASDATASADYRREMIAVFARRALAEAYARAEASGPP